MDSTKKMPVIHISLIDLLHILQISTKNLELESEKRTASDFVLELNKRGHIDTKILGDILGDINPSLKRPEKVTVATRTVFSSQSEELGANGLWWRDVR
jgi:hypothetical protein